jgi:hypothetical protein
VHAARVAVDTETGAVRLLDYLVVEDCGQTINPMIVDGQVYGGVAQGIGQALLEEIRYDAQGQPGTVTLADYLLPGFGEVPEVRIEHQHTLSPFTAYGMKGTGEGGCIGGPAAIGNAVNDALRGLGVSVTRAPVTARDVWTALQAARGEVATAKELAAARQREAEQLAAAGWLRRVFYVETAAWKTSIVTRGVRVFRQALQLVQAQITSSEMSLPTSGVSSSVLPARSASLLAYRRSSLASTLSSFLRTGRGPCLAVPSIRLKPT